MVPLDGVVVALLDGDDSGENSGFRLAVGVLDGLAEADTEADELAVEDGLAV